MRILVPTGDKKHFDTAVIDNVQEFFGGIVLRLVVLVLHFFLRTIGLAERLMIEIVRCGAVG